MREFEINKDESFIDNLAEKINNESTFSTWKLFQMNYHAAHTTMTPSFNGLKALDHLPHIDFLDYQISSARNVIEEMNGRAILADEVGLGKTIEAGLILKEYMLRGLVKKALIIVPASLVNQWVKELNEKFFIPAVSFRKNHPWDQNNIIVTSIDKAKHSPHSEQIIEQNFDFLLVDEAHKLKNHKTKNFELVSSIKKKYCLLLTATPIQNKLFEIFNLVSILKPGHLGDYETFLKQYGKDKQTLNNHGYLKRLVQKVMIRNTRKDTASNDSKRHIETVWTRFSDKEQNVYNELENAADILQPISKITLLRELCSSREACYLSLKKMITDEKREEIIKPLTESIEQLPQHIKAEKTVELIEEIGDKKVIIFTEYRSTQIYLQWFLKNNGILSVPYHGGFKRSKKDWMKQLFENKAQVLIATEAGREGINLQFCNHMINYDLPWNPMRLEQRIGRIHRYGQKEDVYIYNLAIQGTLEEHIMNLLYQKIGLFEDVIGQLDSILAELDINNLESEIETIFAHSRSTGEAKIKLENLASVIKMNEEKAAGGEDNAYK